MRRKHNATAILLFISGCAIGAFAGYLQLTNHHINLASQEPPGQVSMKPALTVIQKHINEELKDTANQTAIQRETTSQENSDSESLSARDFDQSSTPKPIPLVLQQQNNFPKGSQGENSQQNFQMTPNERISQMLEQNEAIQDYNRRYRQAFIRQFLKNAHEHGVDVRLNKNLDVTGISIDTSNRPLLFPPSEVHSSSRK